MSELLVNTIKKADGTGSLTVPAESGTVVVKDGSNDVTLNNITATGVYLGGTGAANYLDDYEEGTWTPTAVGGFTGFTLASANYVKVGASVTVSMFITSITGKSATFTQIGGLPFTPKGSDSYYTAIAESNSDGSWGMVRSGPSSTTLNVYAFNETTSHRLNYNGSDLGSHFMFSLTYQTA